jgi:sulfur-carrier protein
MRVNVNYFAILREQAGKSEELIDIPESYCVSDLYGQLADKYGFQLGREDIRAAINDEFTPLDTMLHDRDHVTFIPPVAGG